MQVIAGDLHIIIVGVALGDGDLLKGHIGALAAGPAQHIGRAVLVRAHGIAGDGKDIVLLADDDLDLSGDTDEQAAVLPVDRDGRAEAAAVIRHGVDAGQRAADDGIAGGIARDAAGHAGRQLADRACGDRDLHGQILHILNRGHRAAADVADCGVQGGDRAVHRSGQGTFLQCGLQAGQLVVLTLGLRKLGGGIVHIPRGIRGRLLVGLLRLLQRIGVVLDALVALFHRVKALQPQLRDAALRLGDALTVLIVLDLALQALGAVRLAALPGLRQLDLQVGKGILVPGDLLGIAGVPVRHDLAVRLAGVAVRGHGAVVVVQPERVIVLLGLCQLLLRAGLIGGLILHAAGIAFLGTRPGIAAVKLGVGDLLFDIGGVQRGDDVALPDYIADRDIDCRDLVGLDRIRRRNAGAAARLDRAVDTDRIAQRCFAQHGGAHILVSRAAGLPGLAPHTGDGDAHRQQNSQKGGQFFVLFDPCKRVMLCLCFLCHTGFPSLCR